MYDNVELFTGYLFTNYSNLHACSYSLIKYVLLLIFLKFGENNVTGVVI